MPTPLLPVITQTGLAAVFRRQADGFAAEISHIAVGDAGYVPLQNQTSLRHEIVRFPIADGVMATPTQAHMTALDDTQREYWVREVGFYLSDGTLFAVYSHPTQTLAYKTAGNDFLHAYDLVLTAVPAGSVVVNSTGANLSLYMAEQLAELAAAQIWAMVRDLEGRDSDKNLQDQVDALKQQVSLLDNVSMQQKNAILAQLGLIEAQQNQLNEQRGVLLSLTQAQIDTSRLLIQPLCI